MNFRCRCGFIYAYGYLCPRGYPHSENTLKGTSAFAPTFPNLFHAHYLVNHSFKKDGQDDDRILNAFERMRLSRHEIEQLALL
jgi:hypothetical protein